MPELPERGRRVTLETTEEIRRWSTSAVPPPQRLDYFAAALSEAVNPLGISGADPERFRAELSSAHLGAVCVTKTVGSPHAAIRGRPEIALGGEHSFNMLLTLDGSWNAEHRGAARMAPRDVMVLDSSYPLRAEVRQDFVSINVAVSEPWLRRWLPDPGALVARRIPGDSLWGMALSSYLGELTPELAARPPLPASVMADQVGSLLALTVNAMRNGAASPKPAERSLSELIAELVAARCAEPELTAADVAGALDVSVRTLHRALSASQRTFGTLLIDARTATATRMLTAPIFKRLTIGEISRRAGFLSPSHFTRVVRLRTGRTPRQLRRAAETDGADEAEDIGSN
jgi:AraC-like DNA-binding protein